MFSQLIISSSLSAAGAKADCALPTILLEYLEFLEILRLFKFEDIITMVSRIVGGATPPSVMALFIIIRAMLEKCGCIVYYYPTLPEEFVRETLPEVAAEF